MSRLYHSSSSVALGERCELAWWFCYGEGIREPEFAWNDQNAPTRARKLALGKEVHRRNELRYKPGAQTLAFDLPGQIAASGAGLLPAPSECIYVETERAIGDEPIPHSNMRKAKRLGLPMVGKRVHGVLFVGFVDLQFQLTAAGSKRLGLPSDRVVVTDYKTTSSIAKWAKTEEQLALDVQHNLYALDACDRHGQDSTPTRWAYFETGKTRRAAPVDGVACRSHALDVLRGPAEKARELDRITGRADALPPHKFRVVNGYGWFRADENGRPDVAPCEAYAGCLYHRENGGPCDARRPLGSRIAALEETRKTMPLPANIKAKVDAAKSERAEAPDAPPPAEKKTRTRKKKEPAKPAAADAPAGLGDAEELFEAVKLAAAEVARLEGELADASETLAASKAKLVEALG